MKRGSGCCAVDIYRTAALISFSNSIKLHNIFIFGMAYCGVQGVDCGVRAVVCRDKMDGSAKINIAKEKLYGAFYLGSLPQVLARVHAIQLLFGIVSPHGNVDSHEYKLL